MTNLTSAEIQDIKTEIAHLSRIAETGADHAHICFLETFAAGGPWFNGASQDRYIAAYRGNDAGQIALVSA